MAPEQIRAELSSPQTDLYALGCTLHEMLTGAQVFTGSSPYVLMNQQVSGVPTPLRRLRPDAPDELAQLLAALLAKRPDERPGSADEVYRRLLPYATDLGPLPGALAPPTRPSPVRMYAEVLGRVLAARPDPAAPAAPAASELPAPSAEAEPTLSRTALDRARSEAGRLVRQSRFHQAAEVLADVAGPASQVFGPTDGDVASLRFELASVLFEGGDYRGAIPVYRELATDLAAAAGSAASAGAAGSVAGPASGGSAAELAVACRLKEATCHALIGQSTEALQLLDALLTDEVRQHGADHPGTFDLRRQIGLLQLGSGQVAAAAATLRESLAVLVRAYGPDHPDVAEARKLLADLPDELVG